MRLAASPSAALAPAALAVLAALCAATPAPAAAQETAPRLPLWEIGVLASGISQQAYPGADQQVQRALLLPFGFYRGRILRADREGAALRAIRTPRFELDLSVGGALGSSSSEIEARRGMPGLGTLVEFGPRAKWLLGRSADGHAWRFELPARGVFDLGHGLARRGLVVEPKLAWERERTADWSYGGGIAAVFGDRRLADTFYGVAPQYATAARPAYEAERGLVAWRLTASFTRRVHPDWWLFGGARIDSVDGAANEASPLVRRRTGASVAVGLVYTWMRSTRPAAD